MSHIWEIDLLGPLTARHHLHRVTHFRTHKTAALLGYLAFEMRPHTRESLMARLWPDANLQNGRNSLSVALSSLRAVLEPSGVAAGSILSADRHLIALNPQSVVTDVQRFRATLGALPLSSAQKPAPLSEAEKHHLQNALDLFCGRFLEGLYEDWIVEEAGKLESLWLRGLDCFLAALQAEGDFAQVQHYSERGISLAPWHEASHLALMEALASQGQTEAARRHFRFWRDKGELGAPSRALRDLVQSLEHQATPERHPEIHREVQSPSSHLAAEATSTSTFSEVAAENGPSVPTRRPPTRLPTHRSGFFGRRAVLGQLISRLQPDSGTRLITLTGLGGGGKTRLAEETAHRLQGHYQNRIWFVALAGLPDSALLGGAVRDELHLVAAPNVPPLEQITAFLADAPSLLVLDNFETLLPAGAAWVASLLFLLPHLACLVTSRQRLGIEGEIEVPLRPLPTPRAGRETLDVRQLLRFAGVRLFVDRARASRPGFALTRRNAAAVSQLCRALDGIPLELELAAARADRLSPSQMLEQFERRALELQSERPDVPERHRSMKAAIGASYALLPPELQQFFRRQAIFRGAWRPEVAAQVCEEPRALHFAAQLRAASLLQLQEQAQETRFSSLETLRDFARSHLDDAEIARLEARHAAHFLELIEGHLPPVATAEGDAVARDGKHRQIANFQADLNDFRAALDWARSAQPLTALKLALALWPWWEALNYLEEGTRQLESAALAASNALPELRARAFFAAGQLAYFRDFALARPLFETSLEIYREASDREGIAQVLSSLSTVLMNLQDPRCVDMASEALDLTRQVGNRVIEFEAAYSLGVMNLGAGQLDVARPLLEGCAAYARECGDEALLAKSLDSLGMLLWAAGQSQQAGPIFEASLEIGRRLGQNWLIAHSLWGVSTVARERGDGKLALRLAREAMEFVRDGHFRWFEPYIMALLAYAELELGWFDHATRLLGAAHAGHEAQGMPLVPLFVPTHERYLSRARVGLADSQFEALWQSGCALSGEEALELALERAPERAPERALRPQVA